MDLIAATSSTPDSTSSASTWCRSVRRRAPEGEQEEGELWRRAEELEAAVEQLRGEKDEAEAEEAALRAELDAERGAAEMAASETMLMIERLQREKAAAFVEARQFRRLAEGRADIDRELQDELASLSALAASYLSLLRAHGIDPDDDDESHDSEEEERPGEHIDPAASGGSDMDVKGAAVVEDSSSPSATEEGREYTVGVGRAASPKAVAAAAVEEEECAVDTAGDLYARVEALEADRAATRREVESLRAERAQVVLAREVARRLCRKPAVAAERAAVVVTAAQKLRFSVLAICKWLLSIILRRRKCSTARFKFGLPTSILGLLLLLDRSNALQCRRRLPRPQI